MEVLDVTCTVGGGRWVEVTGRGWGGRMEGRSQAVDCSLGIKMNYGGSYWEGEAGAGL